MPKTIYSLIPHGPGLGAASCTAQKGTDGSVGSWIHDSHLWLATMTDPLRVQPDIFCDDFEGVYVGHVLK
jgi:hypothetical protein